MEITEARIKLMPSRSDRLQAFCTITIDSDFVIRDIKIIEGAKGAFVAMPSRKLTDKCPKCGGKNHLRARHCNDCGARLDENRATKDKRGRAKLHADIAHPINSACRERIQAKIVEAYQEEVSRSKEPGYVPTRLYDDEDVDDFGEHHHDEPHAAEPPAAVTPVVETPPPAAATPAAETSVAEKTPAATETPVVEKAPAATGMSLDDVDDDLRKPLAESLKELEEAQKEDEDDEDKGREEDDTRGNDFAAGIL